ncbi:MAG: class II fumarate hydratase, partial [Deltaproteobacteria bacterium]|nr:class II fumarate hydratase [Deltaproteobacteria bacterium]
MRPDLRIEHDSMGPVEVPANALYGAQTQRALNNFTIDGEPLPERFIKALLIIKEAAAAANRDLGLLTPERAAVIMLCIRKLINDGVGNHFPVSIYQTGSGTSTNMNVNEVVCAMARDAGIVLSPNDHVNMGQSSNDVIPSALHVSAALQIKNEVIPALMSLSAVIRNKASQNSHVVKTGRTHLMDALPIRLSEEFNGWAFAIDNGIFRLEEVLNRLRQLPLGGTAVGSGVNCHPEFSVRALKALSSSANLVFKKMASPYKGLSFLDTAQEASAHLKTAGCTLMKIANDLRLMNSGPGSGLGEIRLPSLQPGSSIMPDKINPVIPEAVCMAAAQVVGNDATITIAAQSGNFQLNTMLPLTAARLLQSGGLIKGAAESIGEKAIKDMIIMEELLTQP